MRDYNGQLIEIALKKVNMKTGLFRYKGVKYWLDLSINIGRRKNVILYGYCINGGQLVSNADIINDMGTDDAGAPLPEQPGRQVEYDGVTYKQSDDEMINDNSDFTKIFRGLTSQVSKSGIFDGSIIGMIIMMILGIFAGIFIGRFIPV